MNKQQFAEEVINQAIEIHEKHNCEFHKDTKNRIMYQFRRQRIEFCTDEQFKNWLTDYLEMYEIYCPKEGIDRRTKPND